MSFFLYCFCWHSCVNRYVFWLVQVIQLFIHKNGLKGCCKYEKTSSQMKWRSSHRKGIRSRKKYNFAAVPNWENVIIMCFSLIKYCQKFYSGALWFMYPFHAVIMFNVTDVRRYWRGTYKCWSSDRVSQIIHWGNYHKILQRFYGESLPYGPDKSYIHPHVDLLTVDQALADFAVFIHWFKTSLGAKNSPVIAFGGRWDNNNP